MTKQKLRQDYYQLLSANTQSLDVQTLMTLTRQLILFYQPDNEKDEQYVEQYISQSALLMSSMFCISDRDLQDSWIWLCSLLIKRVLLPSMDRGYDRHLMLRIMLY